MVAKFWRNFSYPEDSRRRLCLVGVSGGADSLCLLHGLHTLGVPLLAAHFNHLLRPQAGEDARFVAEMAAGLGIPFVLGQGDVRTEALRTGQSIEAAARAMRYAFLFAQARQHAAWAVAVAHTSDDQVETILLHLLRGSGSGGLQGMPLSWLPNPWSAEIPLLRPMLGVSKAETLVYCAEQALQPVLDETNLDITYTRNRLRRQLLPELETYNPAVRQAVLRLAEVVRGEQEVLQALAAKVWADCLSAQGERFLALKAVRAGEELPGLRRLLARRAFGLLRPGLLNLDFDHLDRFAGWLADPAWHGPADLPGGLRAWREGGDIWLAAWEADPPGGLGGLTWPQLAGPAFDLDLAWLPDAGQTCSLDLSRTWRLEWRLLTDPVLARQQALANSDPFQAWLDLDRLALPLSLRRRWPGARFQPLGLDGHSKKISDLMVDARLPEQARLAWPLLCSGQQVLWAPGLSAGHPARLSEDTRQVLWLGLSPIK